MEKDIVKNQHDQNLILPETVPGKLKKFGHFQMIPIPIHRP